MSSQNYKDLDALVPDEVTAKLGGVEYKLPGDLPLEVYLRMQKAGEVEDEDETRALEIVVNAMCDLFTWNYRNKPEEESIRERVGEVLRNRGVRFNTTLLKNLYGDDEDTPTADESAENPQ